MVGDSSNNNKIWTEEEKEFLKTAVLFMKRSEIARILNRTLHSVNKYIERMGIYTRNIKIKGNPLVIVLHKRGEFEKDRVDIKDFLEK